MTAQRMTQQVGDDDSSVAPVDEHIEDHSSAGRTVSQVPQPLHESPPVSAIAAPVVNGQARHRHGAPTPWRPPRPAATPKGGLAATAVQGRRGMRQGSMKRTGSDTRRGMFSVSCTEVTCSPSMPEVSIDRT